MYIHNYTYMHMNIYINIIYSSPPCLDLLFLTPLNKYCTYFLQCPTDSTSRGCLFDGKAKKNH